MFFPLLLSFFSSIRERKCISSEGESKERRRDTNRNVITIIIFRNELLTPPNYRSLPHPSPHDSPPLSRHRSHKRRITFIIASTRFIAAPMKFRFVTKNRPIVATGEISSQCSPKIVLFFFFPRLLQDGRP